MCSKNGEIMEIFPNSTYNRELRVRDLIKKCIKLHDCIESGRYMVLSRYLPMATVEVFFSKLRCPLRKQEELLRSEKCVVVAIPCFC